MQNSSILFNVATGGDASLGTAGTTPGGLRFAYSVGNLGTTPTGVYSVALPFVTTSHLVALPTGKNELAGYFGKTSHLELVHLEANYSQYFSLYAEKGQQVESRYVLDPEAMQFSIEFCSAYAWEIVNNSLYFSNDGMLPDLHVIDSFVQQITPAQPVQAGLTLTPIPQVPEKLSHIATSLLCPICKVGLRSGKRWLACENGHGYLIRATDLKETREHRGDSQRALMETIGAPPHTLSKVVVVEHGDINCPNDGTQFDRTDFQGSGTSLYMCKTCVYRWIDGKDLDSILGKYRNDGTDDKDDMDRNSGGFDGGF